MMWSTKVSTLFALTLATLGASAARASGQAVNPAMPNVGDVAPDFTTSGATKDGVTPKPVKLSDLRGKTVVLAFFPRARTSGCTHQMTAYRDRYSALFHDGKNITLVAISTDQDTTQADWAREQSFPFLFASDYGGKIGNMYHVYDADHSIDSRVLFVIGPDGKITYRAAPFRELVETSYSDLGSAINQTGQSR
jgi:thioredoxin-dependent peroxiredoxin